MLSFDTVHAITDHLYLADAVHHGDRLSAAPTLLLLQQPSRPSARRLVRAFGIPLPDTDADTALPDHLHRLAHRVIAGVGTSAVTATAGSTPLLAVAVRYADITVHGHAVAEFHRVDAIDTDGRLYRLTRHPGDSTPTLLIDDIPDQAALPATHRGLTAVLAAITARSAQPTGRAR